jgi:hypothetical protein
MRQKLDRLGFTIVRIVLGMVLLTAASLKGYQLATGVAVGTMFWNSRPFMILLVLCEFGFGLWLFVGLHSNVTRIVAIIAFLTLLEIASYRALNGEPSCGCLGQLAINPWYSAIFDLGVLVLLLLFPPHAGNCATISSSPVAFLTFVVAFFLAGIPLFYQMLDYSSSGVPSIFRFDPELRFSAGLQLNNPKTREILEKLEHASGLSMGADTSFFKHEPDYGSLQLPKASTWQVMEMLAQKQLLPARWDKVMGGYYLSRAAGYSLWCICGTALAVFFLVVGILRIGSFKIAFHNPSKQVAEKTLVKS